jgi:hypothetical protein
MSDQPANGIPPDEPPVDQSGSQARTSAASDENRAEFYYRTAERAQRRREVRQGHQWKAAFGVWTLFALGAGTLLVSQESIFPSGHWSITHRIWFWFAFLGIALGFVGLVLRSYRRFLWWVHARNVNDSATGAFCEEQVRRALAADDLPDDLVPKELLDENERSTARSTLHATLELQYWTALLLGVLFLAAIIVNMLKAFATR